MTKPRKRAAALSPTLPDVDFEPGTLGGAEPVAGRLQVVYLPIDGLDPYQNNPRQNEGAITSLMSSIQSFGFLVPIVVDKNHVIVAGHTRHEAAKRLEMTEVPCFIASDLTEDQVKAFRLVDNKVSELASWDMTLLAGEVAGLMDLGIDLTMFGFAQEELDCLGDILSESELGDDALAAQSAGDGVTGAAQSSNLGASHITPDAKSVRVQIGELNFFVDVAVYREWVEGTRKANGYDKDKIVADIAERLGLGGKVQDRKAVLREAREARQGAKAKPEVRTVSLGAQAAPSATSAAPAPRQRVRRPA